MKAYHHCLLLFSTLIAINYSAVAAPSAAQNSLHMARDPVLYPHVEQDIPGQEEQKLRDTETLLLGPTHAAEHAEARAQAKAVAKQAAAQAPLKRFLAQLGLNDHFPSFKQALAGVIGTSRGAIGTPAQVGRWSTPIKIPVVGIHAALLHNGKILFFSYRPPKTTSVGVAYLWNPRTNTGKRVDPPNNIWCGGQTLLADGRLCYVHTLVGWRTYRVEAQIGRLAPGDHVLAFRFDPPHAELLVDGEVVGTGEVKRTVWSRFSLTGAGLTAGWSPDFSPADEDYRGRFEFTGTLHRVDIDVAGDPEVDPEQEAADIIAAQ